MGPGLATLLPVLGQVHYPKSHHSFSGLYPQSHLCILGSSWCY